MSVLCDREIIERCTNTETPMISPFVGHQVKELDGRKLISYGLSCYGFDIRVADEFKLICPISESFKSHIDPKVVQETNFQEFKQHEIYIPPNSMMLCRSLEYFRIPRDIMCIAVGKSTYARCGIIANITPLEAEWEGYLTIELSNTTPLPVKIYANEGICQLLFFKADNICETSYADKKGKYQGQVGVTGSIV
jgi:dCTP deaminase